MSYRIGVDGGGTKTELILLDPAGTIVARHLAPGCNPSQVGPDQARRILTGALSALLADAHGQHGPISATHLYMAGSPAFWREFGTSLTNYGQVVTGPDSLPVLELATNGGSGLALHAGTGSFVTARTPNGAVHYAGGLGWKLGDSGSGFDLGRRAIAVALLELQARGPDDARPLSPLASALCAHTNLSTYPDLSRFFYRDASANAVIAGFAPHVLDLAHQDCGPAQQVVADSVTDFARLVDQVIHRLFPKPDGPLACGVSGRILNSKAAAFALRSLADKLRWPVTLTFLTESPAEGVRRLLLKA